MATRLGDTSRQKEEQEEIGDSEWTFRDSRDDIRRNGQRWRARHIRQNATDYYQIGDSERQTKLSTYLKYLPRPRSVVPLS